MQCRNIIFYCSFRMLEALRLLDLQNNTFERFPVQLCQLKKMEKLNLNENGHLKTLDSGIQSMKELSDLSLRSCFALSSPPLNFCMQGIDAVKQYFADLSKGVSEKLPSATVAVIGQSGAGKTSLIWTLQRDRRVCTGYAKGDQRATKVFNVEEVEVKKTTLRFIDFGGQDIYHQTYRLTLRENCIPVIVVDLQEYDRLSNEIRDREAVRALYFDWMAHLYLAQPNLPPPKLVLTHKDKFPTDEEFEKVKSRFLATTNAVRDAIVFEEDQLNRPLFYRPTNVSEDVFDKNDIFSVGIDEDYSVFKKLKERLHECYQIYLREVPKVWEDIEATIQKQAGCFLKFDHLLGLLQKEHQEVERGQLEIVLSYLHDCGKVLWYKNVDLLKNYVFHKISEVTRLLKILFDHDDEVARWHQRNVQFKQCKINSTWLSKGKYENLVKKFQEEEGIISSTLLAYLIQKESEFTEDEAIDVALKILTSFRLVFGVVMFNGEMSYIVPHLSKGYLRTRPKLDSDIQLQVELVFKGLNLPRYVFHEMTAGLFDLGSPEQTVPSVLRNGGIVVVGGCTIRLVHDAKSGKATISVSSNLNALPASWGHLTDVVNKTIQRIRETWKAVRLVCILYCPHCKLKGSRYMQRTENPPWCVLHEQGTGADDSSSFRSLKRVKCGKDNEDEVHSALVAPCK